MCLGGTSWDLCLNGLVPLFSLKDMAIAQTSPEHCSPLFPEKTVLSHGRWVVAADDEVPMKRQGQRENGKL